MLRCGLSIAFGIVGVSCTAILNHKCVRVYDQNCFILSIRNFLRFYDSARPFEVGTCHVGTPHTQFD